MADGSYLEIYKHEQIKTEYGLPVRYIVYEENDAFISRHWHDDMEIVYLLAGKAVEHVECQSISAGRRKSENIAERHTRQFELGSRFKRKHAEKSTSVVYAVIVAAYEQNVAPIANERVAVTHL